MEENHPTSPAFNFGLQRNILYSQLEKAVQWQCKGMIANARRIYQEILKEDSNQPDALHLLGVLENDNGNYEQAISLISRAIHHAPDQSVFYSNLGNAFRKSGSFQKAIACYKKSIALNPDFHPAYYNLAVAYRQCNIVEDAEAIIKKGLNRNPQWSEAWYFLGDLRYQNGNIAESIACFEKVLEIDPKNEQAWFFVGNAYRLKKDYHKAASCYRKALAIKPDFVECLNNLGLCCFKANKLTEAVDCYESALRYQPDFAEAYYNSGNVFYALGRYDKAITCYQTAQNFKPEFFDSMVGLGKLYHHCGDYSRAIYWYRKALFIEPDNWRVTEHLGHLKRFAGDIEGAFACYRKVLEINPDAHTVYVGIGNTYRQLSKLEEAVSYYRRAIEINPGYLPALNNLAIALTDIGKTKEALAIFNRMLEVSDDFSTHIKIAMTLPVIYPSTKEMYRWRDTFASGIERLGRTGGAIADPYHEVGIANFMLALHGVDEKPIRKMLSRFYLHICPQLAWSSPILGKKKRNKRIRLGMVCRYLHNHTIGRLYGGLIDKIDKSSFDLFIFRFDRQDDSVSRSIDHCAREVVWLPQDIFAARERIAAAELDVLFFPEIGMDPLTYFIAFSRLAPVQCKRGFQITMGIPTIDYFISSAAAEPPDAQQYYSEKLVCLEGTGYYYPRPRKPDEFPQRASFGLPEDRKLYACTQSLFKLHPDFDAVLETLLEKDPKGTLVLLEGLHPHWKMLLLNRFRKTAPGIVDRIHFLPRQPREKFLNLHRLADAVIDTIYFSGGNTSLECFAWGIPVVTWPSDLLPGRLTYGFYKQMGIMDCVAWDQDSYVNIAYRLANDPSWRDEVGNKIMERSTILFENIEDVKELERFFKKAVNQAYREK